MFPTSTFKPELLNNDTFDFFHQSLNQKLTLVKEVSLRTNPFSPRLLNPAIPTKPWTSYSKRFISLFEFRLCSSVFFYYIEVSFNNVTLVVDNWMGSSCFLMVSSEYWQSNKSKKFIKTWPCLPQYSNSIFSERKDNLLHQNLNRKFSLMEETLLEIQFVLILASAFWWSVKTKKCNWYCFISVIEILLLSNHKIDYVLVRCNRKLYTFL